ncbi:MAG: hypothetical protein A3C93_00930 [Candidatus Lloydbacteria bacterium RIFCSPHIGHO2_02_FULL_54_17]|uniref:EF-hand domain-containing protein n=1 Tax=Candidatus Lloydbacteria bacterium RIFCSPHIGHO2_02_FULL_54_17 TaxID=1798664 RepID=A0A1G2DF19_9BACT|nr:MAG: hypothetical protein A3C93_00930 [Candidatus Lloydbacteria bacterium RIFCSPHIGHO2_02_FULL_54_17]OGZ14833.1 MAG: hypothetical protein A3H76_05125 [Candidatus Lloydbacteria bacterium RIFCSPLOWO2_02_FULL_54_12]
MNAKHLVSGVVLGALLLSPMLSFAQAGTPSVGAREAGTGKATGRVASTTVAERKEEMREKMAERRSAILQRIAERMIRHMEAAIERMEKIATRIDSRIAKLKERGVNTAASEALLATARQKLAAATTAVESAKGAMATALAVADVDADGDGKMDKVDPGKTVREFLTTARNAVKDAHRALVEAIKSLKSSAELRDKNTGSTTPVTP